MQLKSHSCHDVVSFLFRWLGFEEVFMLSFLFFLQSASFQVLMCVPCHAKSDIQNASLRAELAKEAGVEDDVSVPLTDVDREMKQIRSSALTLMNRKNIPEDRKVWSFSSFVSSCFSSYISPIGYRNG
jgi:hypothetical protein